MTRLRVCWVQHGGEWPWACQLSELLKARDVDVRFVTILREIDARYRDHGFETDFIGHLMSDPVALPAAHQAELERRYGPPNLASVAESDMHLHYLYGLDVKAKAEAVARALAFWENYLPARGIQCLLARETAKFATRTAYLVAKRLGIPMLVVGQGPGDDHFAALDVGQEWCWSEFVTEFAKGMRPLTEEERAEVERFVATRTRIPSVRMTVNVSEAELLQFPQRMLREWLSERRVNMREDPVEGLAHRVKRRYVSDRLIWKLNRKIFPYAEPADEPYVFMPLFHKNESQLVANTRFWCRNLHAVVAEVASSLPDGFHLYVKEHPSAVGDQTPWDLWRLRSIPRVRLIAPDVSSKALVAKSSAVFCLLGSVGWETILLRKPLVLMGSKPFYAYAPFIYEVSDVRMLESALTEAIRQGDTIYDEQHEVWQWFIHCALVSAPRGCLYTYEYPHASPSTLEQYQLIADGLSEKIHRLASSPMAIPKEEKA